MTSIPIIIPSDHGYIVFYHIPFQSYCSSWARIQIYIHGFPYCFNSSKSSSIASSYHFSPNLIVYTDPDHHPHTVFKFCKMSPWNQSSSPLIHLTKSLSLSEILFAYCHNHLLSSSSSSPLFLYKLHHHFTPFCSISHNPHCLDIIQNLWNLSHLIGFRILFYLFRLYSY